MLGITVRKTPPNINTISEIQASGTEQSIDTYDKKMTLWVGQASAIW